MENLGETKAVFQLGGLAIIVYEKQTFIQEIATGEGYLIENYNLELELRKLF